MAESESTTDRTNELVCGRCQNVKSTAVEHLLLCAECDKQVLRQAAGSVQGRIEREPCPCSMCAKAAG